MRLTRTALPLLGAAAIAAIAAAIWNPLHSPAAPLLPQNAPISTTSTQSTVSSSTGPLLAAAGLTTTGADGATHVDAQAVRAALAKIPDGATSSSTYDRDAFGPAWADVDHNGCDTRNDVLRRDLVDVQLKPGTHDCTVLSGTLHDPYTGQEISFVRGEKTSTAVQIDHIWPLGLVWQHGASTWSPQLREAFANDPAELQAVDGPSNESKSDDGPGAWLPPAAGDHCEYVARFTYIAVKYSLTIAPADRAGITAALDSCS